MTPALSVSTGQLSAGESRSPAFVVPCQCRSARWALLCGLLLTLLASMPARATQLLAMRDAPPMAPSVPAKHDRQRVGLVLSGGGARGGAHIGVLRVLERMNIPIDLIVGTSAGSIVGAAYASGLPLDQIEAEMQTLDAAKLFRDVSRDDLTLRRKSDDGSNFIGPEVGVSGDGLQLPKGAVAGVSLEVVLRRLTRRQVARDFDRLPIPFRAIATDLTTGDLVLLDHGSLATAIRASMAIPGVVNPVDLDGRLLVDGGLVRQLPVDIARRMGADVVIAVNVSSPLSTRDQIKSIVSVSNQMLRILIESNLRESLHQISSIDVLITPKLEDFGAADFGRLPIAAASGEAAAQEARLALAALSMNRPDYEAMVAARQQRESPTDAPIAQIRVNGARRVNAEVVRESMQTREGMHFDAARLDADMKRIYGLGDFEGVTYSLTTDNPEVGPVLDVDVTEKAWGPNFIRFGLNLSSDMHGNAYFNLFARHRVTALNSLGGEWRNDVQVGYTDRLRTEFYQPLTERQRLFAAGWGEWERRTMDLYNERGSRLARLQRRTVQAGVDLGLPLGTTGEARVGVSGGRLRFADETALIPLAEAYNVTLGGARMRVRYDTLNSVRFPRSGIYGDLQLYHSTPRLGATDSYSRAELQLYGARSYNAHTLSGGLRIGGNLRAGALPIYEQFALGGFLNLSGYQTDQLLGDQLTFGRVVYMYRLSSAGIFDGTYLGGSLEGGRIGASAFRGADRGSMKRSGSLFVAVDSPIGPLYLAVGLGQEGNRAMYLFLGQPL